MMGSGSSSTDWPRGPPQGAQIIYKIGIYGWRKRCLYVFILLLMVTVVINLALTIWILRVMDFSVHGMGKLRIVDEGVRVEGRTEFLKNIRASHIKSRQDSALSIESSRNITLNARNAENVIENRLFLGNQKIESYADMFEIYNTDGQLLFSADSSKVHIGAKKVEVSSSGGVVFNQSVQTKTVHAHPGHDIRLESPTRKMKVMGTEGVQLQAPAGSIKIDSVDDIKLTSKNNTIVLDGKSVSIKNLKLSRPILTGPPLANVYQLCICGDNGKLFLSTAEGKCQAFPADCN